MFACVTSVEILPKALLAGEEIRNLDGRTEVLPMVTRTSSHKSIVEAMLPLLRVPKIFILVGTGLKESV